MKPSEFLSELEGHGIYDAASLAADFTQKTGLTPCWSTHTAAATAHKIAQRGLGGRVAGTAPVVYGYEIAADLAAKYAHGFRSWRSGRGSSFWDCVEALRTAGQ